VRVRVRFAKTGKIRWTSHRDVARMWERAFRRVDLPLAYTQGFTPRPRVSFGLALSTGHESVAEYLDLELAPDSGVQVAELAARLTPELPIGVDVLAAAPVDDGTASLQEDVTSCTWLVEAVPTGPGGPGLAALVEEALAAPSLVITRRRKGKDAAEDVRPAIASLEADGNTLRCDLATQPRGLRPSELLAALSLALADPGGAGLEEGRVRRLHQWIERDGVAREPLPLTAAGAPPHALRRAS